MVVIKQTSSMAMARRNTKNGSPAAAAAASLPSSSEFSNNSKRLSHALNVATLSALSSLSADDIIPLTKTGSTWIVHLSGFFKPPTEPQTKRRRRQDFHTMYRCHPKEKHPIKVFGKQTYENRFSQLYVTDNSIGDTYRYSGTTRKSIICNSQHNIDDGVDDGDDDHNQQQFVIDLCHMADTIVSKVTSIMNVVRDEEKKKVNKNNTQDIEQAKKRKSVPQQPLSVSSSSSSSSSVSVSKKKEKMKQQKKVNDTSDEENHDENPIQKLYNCCLVNWYEPEHSIGLHSDDEMEMNPKAPIISLSWGGPRRFLLRPKKHIIGEVSFQTKFYEVLLKDGDLLIMGGNCQQEFKHEVPKVRKMDGLVDNRISWTIRSLIRPNKKRPRTATTRSTIGTETTTTTRTTTTSDTKRNKKILIQK